MLWCYIIKKFYYLVGKKIAKGKVIESLDAICNLQCKHKIKTTINTMVFYGYFEKITFYLKSDSDLFKKIILFALIKTL